MYGTDYPMYHYMYFNQDNQNLEKVEIGYKILMHFSYKIFGNYFYLFFTLCSALTIIPIYYIIKKKSRYPSESLFYYITLGFYLFSFNIIRQSLAMALCFFALRFLLKKNFLKYLFTIIIASSFHITALIMLPMYWLARIKLNTKKLIGLMVILSSIGVLFNPIFNYLVSIIPQYSIYANYNGADVGIGTYIINTIYLILIFLIVLYKKRISENNKENNMFINIVTFSTFFIVASLQGTLFARLIYYWFLPIILLLPDLMRQVKVPQRTALQGIIALLFITFYIIHIYSFNGIFPYNSIFTN